MWRSKGSSLAVALGAALPLLGCDPLWSVQASRALTASLGPSCLAQAMGHSADVTVIRCRPDSCDFGSYLGVGTVAYFTNSQGIPELVGSFHGIGYYTPEPVASEGEPFLTQLLEQIERECPPSAPTA